MIFWKILLKLSANCAYFNATGDNTATDNIKENGEIDICR